MSDIQPSTPIVHSMDQGVPAPVAVPAPTAMPSVPAGWYDDPSSRLKRWWDGEKWTEHFAPVEAHPQVVVNQINAPAKKRVNHALHLVLTILTVGLWAPVWIILAIANS